MLNTLCQWYISDDQPKSVFYGESNQDDFLSFEDLEQVMKRQRKLRKQYFVSLRKLQKEKLSFPSCITN